MKHVVLIDNYDSFTWNIYEYLSYAGAKVTVHRNDKITIKELAEVEFDVLVISPGPGHPQTDSGISRDAIRHFKGIKPIFGVCMGQQCMIDVFGGQVTYAGEIVHGKTSTIEHDGKGIFKGVPQGVAVTRYHSLAGSDLPDCLEVTAKTEGGVIMGIRHKEYVIEGVQFHPESILTEQGHLMVANMLKIEGGLWKDVTSSATASNGGILSTIFNKRQEDYETLMETPGCHMEDLQQYYNMGLAPEVKDFYQHLKSQEGICILSEIKRASPSKGGIDLQANAAKQGLTYANAGVSAISVLTEPNWFKGQLKDLEIVRKVVDKLENRPCVLRKEFIFNKYQVLEARLAGADTVLLIVKMLTEDKLKELIEYSRSLGMEPLVEVNTQQELQVALAFGSKVIGVNNRNLMDFKVDLNTTTNLLQGLSSTEKEEVIILGLSGIQGKEDVENYKSQGVKGVLIGETLMKQGDKVGEFIKSLLE